MSYARPARTREVVPEARGKTSPHGPSTGLKIGAPNDAFEQEANRVADMVTTDRGNRPRWSITTTGITAPTGSASVHGGVGGSEDQRERARAPRPGLQRRPEDGGNATPPTVPSIVRAVLQTPGTSLDLATRAFFEPRLGHNFGQVRIHTDSLAAESAQALDARAYAVGNDIVFNARRYAPTTTEGRRLLAHELTHVVQQASVANGPVGLVRRQPLTTDDPRRARLKEIEALLQTQVINDEYRAQLEAEQAKIQAELDPGAASARAKPVIRLDYPPTGDAYHGIQLAYVAMRDLYGKSSGSPGVRHSTLYFIAPQLGKSDPNQAVAYIAYNPQLHRNEWVIGPGQIGTFLAHERMYFGMAQATYPFGDRAEPPAYAAESGRMAERALAGDLKGMFRAWLNSWSLAVRDPMWWVQAVTATAGGLAAAPEAEAGAAARAGGSEASAATKAASGPQYYIQDGVRRAVAAREAGLADVPATVYQPGQAPQSIRIPLDQLNSPKPAIPYDPRFSQGSLRPALEGSTPPPITVEPLGRPGQVPTTPLRKVKIEH